MADENAAKEILAKIEGTDVSNLDDDKIKNLITTEIEIDHIDCYTNEHYTGKLAFVIPSASDRIKVARMRSNLLGGGSVNILGDEYAYATVISWIYACCKPESIPDWLKLERIRDTDVLDKIFEKIQKHLEFFRSRDTKRKDQQIS